MIRQLTLQEMSDFETWVYRGVIAVTLIILWYFARQVLNQLKEMNVQLKQMNDKGIVHDGKLELINNTVDDHRNRLNDHSKRIRTVEQKQDRCKTCREA